MGALTMHEIHHQIEVNLINWISRLRLNAREILKGWSPHTRPSDADIANVPTPSPDQLPK